MDKAQGSRAGRYWIGFDLGGTKMLACVYDAAFKCVGMERQKSRAGDGVAVGIRRMADTIEAALERSGVSLRQVAGIGFGVPGPLDLEKGLVIQMPNLGWEAVPLQKKMEDRFGCRVVLANDVDAGTYGEYRFGAGRGARALLGVFPGTGIGGAFIREGRLLTGARTTCMEIGHIRVVSQGPRCGCGRVGCLETVASRLAIASQAAIAVHRGEAPHLARLAGTDLAELRSGALQKAVRQGDKAIEFIVREAARRLGSAIASLINLLGPDVVVLGGGLTEAFPAIFREECRKTAEEEVMRTFRGTYRIETALLGDDATARGAAALAATPEALGRAEERRERKP